MKKIKVVKTNIKQKENNYKYFNKTLSIYNNALSFCIPIINEYWDFIIVETALRKRLSGGKQIAMNVIAEILIHTTSDNVALYPQFDILFYKFPSYLRRAMLAEAVGIVMSFRSNYQNWKQKKYEASLLGKRFKDKEPKLQVKHSSFPVMYKSNMFKLNEKYSNDRYNKAEIKVFTGKDWIWTPIKFKKKPFNNRDLDKGEMLSPSLAKICNKFELQIPFEFEIKLSEKKQSINDILERIVVSVDLGLTTTAVCCALKGDGTVISRKFINQDIEKDRLSKQLKKISKAKKKSGNQNMSNLWRKFNGLQDFIVQDTITEIINFAIKSNADTIIFEHLGNMKIPKGFYGARRLRYKLQFWAKMRIQKGCINKAHLNGLRISKINAKNTSKLAFDGSGEVLRIGRKDISIFKSGKIYNADLSASYNIGARYFLREYLKTMSEKMSSGVQAKVPELQVRTRQTLSSLISLVRVLNGQPIKSCQFVA